MHHGLLRREHGETALFGSISLAMLAIGNLCRHFLTIGDWLEVQFFISYQDLGFVKRGVVGSLFRFASIVPNATNTFLFSVAVSLAVVAAYWRFAVASFGQAAHRRPVRRLFVVFAASPATFLNLGYDLGRYDQIGILLLLLSIRALTADRFVWVGLLSALGVLVHEAYFILFLPLVVAVAFDRLDLAAPAGSAPRPRSRLVLTRAAAVLCPAIVALFLVSSIGAYEPGYEALKSYFERVSPEHAVSPAVKIWSRTLSDNVSRTMVRLGRELPSLPLGAIYLALFGVLYFRYQRANRMRRDLVFWSPFAVLFLCPVGSDFYRWLSVCMFNMTVAMSYRSLVAARAARRAISVGSNKLAWALVVTCVLGPIGLHKLFPVARAVVRMTFEQ